MNYIEWLKVYKIPGLLILTKADKLSKTKQKAQERAIAKALSVDKDDLIIFSKKTRKGRESVWEAIMHLIPVDRPDDSE